MAESIRFDFLSSGAAKLAAEFRNTGDSASAASRGAKVLQTVIENLGQKENRTAAESANLAKALRLTGDAEDRAAAKALAADIAIRRLDDALKDSSKSAGSARGGFAGLAGEITGFGAAAAAADAKSSLFARSLAGINLASGVLEPALAGVVVAAGGLAAGFAAAGAGLGVFGAVAKSVFSEASGAATKYAAAQQKYANATTAKQRTAALQAEKNALAGLSPPVKTLAGELGNLKGMWKAFTDAAAPGVVGVLSQGIGILSDHFGLLKPFLAPTETALSHIMAKLNTGLDSAGFKSFLDLLAKNTGPAIEKIATAIGNVVVGIGGILRAFMPTSQQMLTGIDKITARFREWGTTLSGNTGFASLMATFRTETPQAVAILKNLGEVLLNVGKAMFGLSTFSNSKMLLQALLPLSGVLASLSKNTGLVRIALYLYAATAAAGKLRPAMTALFGAGGEGGIIRGIGKAVTGIGNMTKAMLGLDAASNANVIGLVVIAIAALGAAFYVAWQKSAGFRDVIKDIGVVLLAAGILIVKYNKMIVDSFLSVIGTILHGLADAFGWIPGGVGNALRSASKSFDSFKAGTDRVLNGMIGTMQGWQNSLNASKITVAAATASIVANFHGQGAAARQSRTDVTNYTAAVLNNGNTSNAAQSARKQLITDLEHAGLSAQAANKLVNDLSAAIRSLPSKTVQIHMDGTGLYTITGSVIAASQGKGGSGNAAGGLAAGGRITGPGGPRSDTAGLFALSHGEWVIRADSAARYGLAAMDAVNQGKAVIGYASGGPVKGNLTPAYISGMYGTFQKDMTDAMVAAMRATMKTAVAAAKAAAAAAGGIGNYKPGAGVAQWASVISRALAMLGLSPGLLGAVEAQMASESGGNPYAINKRDSNWLAGHPSVGLMQVIRGTFQAYAGQFRNTGPFAYGVSENPLANVYAALNYGKHGAGFGTGPGQIGSMHGYASGTVGAAPGWAWVGERGPELVRFRGGEQVTPGDGLAGLAAELRALRAEVRQLTDVAAAIPARTGQHVAGAVGGTGADAAFRRRYPASR